MKIVRTQNSDIKSVQQIYQEARDYQLKTVGYGWSVFSKEFILQEISEKRHYKAVDLRKEIVGVFSVVYSEPLIWDDYEGTEAIYLHRMAIKNKFRGSGFAKQVIEWTIIEAWKHKKNFIRIDTWANNQALTGYYQKLGFKWVGKKQLPPTSDLPGHYNNIEVNLFEMKL